MRVDVPNIVCLLQTAHDNADALTRAPWWALWILAALGGTAGAAKIWSVVAEYLKDKRDAAKLAAEEDKLRRDAKTKAEIAQVEALTAMARDVPKQFEAMTTRFDAALTKVAETNALTARRLDENTSIVRELKDVLHSDTRALVLAIAGKLDVQADTTSASGVRRLSSPDLEPKARHA
jgi:hypothetical protein